MAQPRGRRDRKRLSGRHLEELRQQSGAGRRAAARSRSRRVRPLVPPPAARRGGRHGRRRRPSRHLRHPRSREGGSHSSSSASGRAARWYSKQASTWRCATTPSRSTATPTTPPATSTPATCSSSRAGTTATIWSRRRCDRRLHVGDPRLGQCRKRRGGCRGRWVPPAPKEGRSTQSDCGVRWRPSRGSNAASNSTSIPRGRSTWTTMPTIRANWPPRSPRCGGCFRVTALFQPHLYTRTRDFYREFAEARRRPTKCCCCRSIPHERNRSRASPPRSSPNGSIVGREALAATLGAAATDVVVSFGAGNIDACCDAVADVLRKKA